MATEAERAGAAETRLHRTCASAELRALNPNELVRFRQTDLRLKKRSLPCIHVSAWLLVPTADGHAAAGSEVVRGRTNEATLNILRTKPGRAHSIPAISLSCSDKLASYVALGVQGSLLLALLEPTVPSIFVVGFVPKEHFPLSAEEQGFCHSKEPAELAVRAEQSPEQAWDDTEPVPAAGSVIWTRTDTAKGIVENVVAGLKMGASPAKKKVQELLPLHSSRRSTLCKLNWYRDILMLSSEF
ncbi:unnamed protein product [Tilletia laevis]|uniref:tRNA-specific adenosine deaminase 1 n=1 Tax=Tilletia laevis TaxID=157183 RepID=A0A9N8QHI9_9BASI|nr:unnamed protein product [Tilletia laevis]CAD6957566.1 unnamed protein product [Tilletia laevis]CAD6970167.1 unnamed protein product [Tilletia controversa]CAD6978412.1 unnamed protein product [Tilletia controversa]